MQPNFPVLWIPADQPAAAICQTEAGYELKGGSPTWQMARVFTGQEKKSHFCLIRLDPEKLSPTILRGTRGTTTGLVHPWHLRRLTIAEINGLALFPDQFQLQGSYRENWARIRNSVPPLLMKAVAGRIGQGFPIR